jgi:release factor glutamine methyltransferase
MTVAEALSQASRRLAEAGVDNPRLDARLLLAASLGLPVADVPLLGERLLAAHEEAAFESRIARRVAREPASRILGSREFWSLPFALGTDTLDPRPDSETLVEAALAQFGPEPRRVLDLGTGSGCLLLAILSERPSWSGIGLDIAPGAIAVARDNAKRLGLAERARFETGDWQETAGAFDLIVANPPYIPSDEIASLAPEVGRYEPRRALDGGADGLDAYRSLAPVIAGHLQPDGRTVLEIGKGQGDHVAVILSAAGVNVRDRRRDLSGIERCLVAGLKIPVGKAADPN